MIEDLMEEELYNIFKPRSRKHFLDNVFDVYDSSNINYNEFFNPFNERDEQFCWQYRSRAYFDIGGQRITENTELTEGLIRTAKERQNYFMEDMFDMTAYSKSETFKKRKEYIDEKVQRTIARGMNYEVTYNMSEMLGILRISVSSQNRASEYAKGVLKVAKESGINKLPEIAMYMISDTFENIAVDDVILGLEQIVDDSMCKITELGNLKTMKQIENEGKYLIGWEHSHVFFNNYFSSTDDVAMTRLFSFFSQSKKIMGDQKLEFFYGMVINAKDETPALRLMVRRPRYFVDQGKIKIKYETLVFDRDSDSEENAWPVPKYFGEETELSEDEKDEIRIDIKNSVKIKGDNNDKNNNENNEEKINSRIDKQDNESDE